MAEETHTRKKVEETRLRQLRSALLIPIVLAFVGICYLYGRFIEVDWIRTKHLSIPVQGLPEEFNGFTIIHLSDLHISEMGRREKHLARMVNSIRADAIFITGDFADTDKGLQVAASIIAGFQAKYGKWGVLGNWDSNRTTKICAEAGMKILQTEADIVEVGGQKLGIVGLRFDDAVPVLTTQAQREIISNLKAKLPADIPIILLEHEPRIIHAAQEEGIDIVLSGHTHGGQVRIPFGPAIETPSDMGVRYTKGLFKFKDTYLYISPGIGLEPGPDYIQVRFWCRPEITVIALHPER